MRKILLVDDSALIREIVGELLRGKGYEVLEASSGREALLRVKEFMPHLVILDLEMPDMGGLEVLKLMREEKETKDIPVIILTSDSSSDTVVKLLEEGADDYILKGSEDHVFLARVKVQLRTKELIDELKEIKKKLEILSITDELTGCYNRRFFMLRLKEEFSKAKRHGTPLSLVLFDLDHFKRINDTYGHSAGDEVLKRVADLMRRSIRIEDVLARYGGEEFVILSSLTNKEGAYSLAERIRKLIEENPVEYEGREIRFTISGGVSSINEDIIGPEALIKVADTRLYKAKEMGRNLIVKD